MSEARRSRHGNVGSVRSSALATAASCVAALVLAGCSSDGLPMGEPLRLNEKPGAGTSFSWPYYTAVVVRGDSVATAWLERSTGQDKNVGFRASSDGGRTFGPEVLLNEPEFAGTISVVPNLLPIPGGDGLLAIWQARKNVMGQKSILARRSEDFGKTWGGFQRLNSALQSFLPSVAVRADGGVLVAFSDERDTKLNVYANRSLDGGKTWLPNDVRLDRDNGINSDAPSSAMGDDGWAYVLWEERARDRRRLLLGVSPDAGATWNAPVRVDPDGMPASPIWPRLAEVNGRLTAVWTGGISGRESRGWLWMSTSSDRGTTWSAPTVLYEGPTQPYFHLLEQAGRLLLVWHGGSTADAGGIYFNASDDGGATWRRPPNDPLRIDIPGAGQGKAFHPRMATADPNRIAVTWHDGEKAILLSTSGDAGRTWSAQPTTVASIDEADKSGLRFPQVAVTDTAAYVLWEHWTSGEGLYKTLADTEKLPPMDVWLRRVTLR